MGSVRIGGDPENYMDPPQITGGDGGPSIIASILDLLGIHKQVVKAPETPDQTKESNDSKKGDKQAGKAIPKSDTMQAAPKSQASTAQQFMPLPAIAAAESVFLPQRIPSGIPAEQWLGGYQALVPPMRTVDPDSIFNR